MFAYSSGHIFLGSYLSCMYTIETACCRTQDSSNTGSAETYPCILLEFEMVVV